MPATSLHHPAALCESRGSALVHEARLVAISLYLLIMTATSFSLLPEEPPGCEGQRSRQRLPDVDVIKGCLVTVMVLYHCVCVTPSDELRLVTYAIPFIHSAFLVITGFLCGYHYWPRVAEDGVAVSRRLLGRASRLTCLFLGSNLILMAAGLGRDFSVVGRFFVDLPSFLDNCIVGISGECFAFEILMYIAEFLFLAGLIARFPRYGYAVLVALILAALTLPGNTLLFLAFGAWGMLAGIAVGQGGLSHVHRLLNSHRFVVLVLWLLVILVESKGDPRLPNAVKLPLRAAETVLWFYAILLTVAHVKACRERLAFLGKYTLFGYLFQMPAAVLVYAATRHLALGVWGRYVVSVCIVTVATYMAVSFLHRLRTDVHLDRVYQVVFG